MFSYNLDKILQVRATISAGFMAVFLQLNYRGCLLDQIALYFQILKLKLVQVTYLD